MHISDLSAWCKIQFEVNSSNPLYNAHHLYINENEVTNLVIPNNITSINNYAFNGCNGLTSVTIPNSVTDIGWSAFANCSGLKSVNIGNRASRIGSFAFSNCIGLTSVNIPASVRLISNNAFSYCSGLTSIIIGKGVEEIKSEAFRECKNLTDVYCYAESFRSSASIYYSDEGNPLYTSVDAFKDSYIEYATLHVPATLIDDYKTTEPWKNFKEIVGLNGEMQEKCATPVIIYENGKVMFACATEGVEYVTDIVCTDNKKYYSSAIDLAGTYTVSVYATKAGYENSDVATLEITLSDNASDKKGDVNGDGVVDAADVVKVTNIIMGE